MSLFETGFEKCAAFCIGATAVGAAALGHEIKLPDGATELVTGGAALMGMVVQSRFEFRRDQVRVAGHIRAALRRKYGAQVIAGEDGRQFEGVLWSADDALQAGLANIKLGLGEFSDAALTQAGFVTSMTDRVLAKLAAEKPSYFGDDGPVLAKAFARDALEAGFAAIIESPEAYKKIDGAVSLEIARQVSRVSSRQDELIEQVAILSQRLLAVRELPFASAPEPIVAAERTDDHFSSHLIRELRAFGVKVEKLTAEQFRVIDHLRHWKKARVMGCAGSGKTLVACEKASRLAAAGLRTLVLCHNPLLAGYLRTLLRSTNITVFSFTALVEHLLEGETADASDQAWNIYDEPLDDQLTHAFDKAVQSPVRFDAVVVDEGQDFRSEWWILVEALLRDPSEGVLYVFHDDAQALLYGRGDYPIATAPIEISRNCRNSPAVLKAMARYSTSPPPEDDLFEHTGFVATVSTSKESQTPLLVHGLRTALNLGLEPANLMVVTLGQEQTAIEETRLAVPAINSEGWQDSLASLLRNAERHQDTDYEYASHSIRKAEWQNWFYMARTCMPYGLSEATSPTDRDVEAVARIIRDECYFSAAAEQHLAEHPDLAKLSWHSATLSGPILEHPSARRLRALQIAAFLRSPNWADDLRPRWWVELGHDSVRNDPDRVPVLSVGASKGLEADVAILLVDPHGPLSNAEKYIAISRGRFGLIVCDPGKRLLAG